jgi:hypothetical protein
MRSGDIFPLPSTFQVKNMNIIKSFFVVCVSALAVFGLSGCGVFIKNDAQKNEICQCYWMENYSGKYKWIPSKSIRGMKREITKTECYELDSCDGGLGRSNGGCYKWAFGAENTRIPW